MITYLACDCPRRDDARKPVGDLQTLGVTVVCPALQWHPHPGGCALCRAQSVELLAACGCLVVLLRDGWSEAAGVVADVVAAHERHQGIVYWDPALLGAAELADCLLDRRAA